NYAFQLTRVLHQKPIVIANQLAEKIQAGIDAGGGPVGSVDMVGGFLNLRLDAGWLVQSLRGVVEAGSEWGRSDAGAGERVQVEFVSANPTGPLLVSAGRG